MNAATFPDSPLGKFLEKEAAELGLDEVAADAEREYALHLESAVNTEQPEDQDDLYTAVLRLDTFRPVRLEFGVTMHRDVIPNDAGWIRREDVLAAIANATGEQP